FSRFTPPFATFGIDAQQSVVLGQVLYGNSAVIKLDATGAEVWAVPVSSMTAVVVAVGPDGHVAAWYGTTLSRLAPDGTTEWSTDLGETLPGDLDFYRHLGISGNGDIVVELFASIRVYASDGTLRWTAGDTSTRPLAVKVDPQGLVTTIVCCPDTSL